MKRTSSSGPARIGLVQFPGSNCDMDCVDTLKRHFGISTQLIWHTESALPQVDAVVLPGGFSYGDYLRSGALASHSPIMSDVKRFVQRGGAVIGICNGFQVLTESHLLPGALLRNDHRRFICKYITLRAAAGNTAYHAALPSGKLARMPVAHGEGRYYIDSDGMRRLSDNGQLAYLYVNEAGEADRESNPNGSMDSIAGVVSENGRVLGLMPHPERATDVLMGGSADGLAIWQGFLASFM